MRAMDRALLIGNLLLFAFAAVSFILLPETIVHHWGFDGPDRIGDRSKVFIIPSISIVTFAVSSSLSAWYLNRDPVDGDVFRCVMLFMSTMVLTVCTAGTLVVLAYNV